VFAREILAGQEVVTLYEWLVFAHVVGVFGFLLAHGVSAAVVFRVRFERDTTALRALLNLSARSLMASYISLLVLLAGGLGAAFIGRWWSFGWPWAALGVLIVTWLLMLFVTGPSLHRVRLAVGITREGLLTAPAKPEDLSAAVARVCPWLSVVTGGAGLLIILWLMMFKPF
jgi:hypothetical protein